MQNRPFRARVRWFEIHLPPAASLVRTWRRSAHTKSQDGFSRTVFPVAEVARIEAAECQWYIGRDTDVDARDVFGNPGLYQQTTVERLAAEHEPDLVGLSVMTFQRRTAKGIIDLVRTRRPARASSAAMIRASLPRTTPRTLTGGSTSSCGARARSRSVSCCARFAVPVIYYGSFRCSANQPRRDLGRARCRRFPIAFGSAGRIRRYLRQRLLTPVPRRKPIACLSRVHFVPEPARTVKIHAMPGASWQTCGEYIKPGMRISQGVSACRATSPAKELASARGSRLGAVSETGITAHLSARFLACRTAGRRARSKCNAAAVYATSKREDLRCQTSG